MAMLEKLHGVKAEKPCGNLILTDGFPQRSTTIITENIKRYYGAGAECAPASQRGTDMDREQEIRRFFLLQVNDALFPIGGYSHSQGLETYIQQGSVCDEKTAAEYIHKNCVSHLLIPICWQFVLRGN